MQLMVMLIFAAVLGVLGWNLYLLVADTGRRRRKLTVRVALSVSLFLFLYVSWYFGLVEPSTTEPNETSINSGGN